MAGQETMSAKGLPSLHRAIFEETGKRITGRYRRYKSRKWRFIGYSDVPTPDGESTYLLFDANFNDKHQVPYVFLVAVDVDAQTIVPVEELEEDVRELLADTNLSSTPHSKVKKTKPKSSVSHRIWIAEVSNHRFPRHADPDRPQLVIGRCKGDALEHINELNEQNERQSRFAGLFPYRPRMDLLDTLPKDIRGPANYKKSKLAKVRRRKIQEHLRDNGYVVESRPDLIIYTVYVVNLSDTTGPRKNPKPWVYVGQTRLSPEERLRRHLEGHRTASKWVHKHGVDLNRELMRGVPQTRFRQDAEHLEKQHAARLEAAGFNVKGGH